MLIAQRWIIAVVRNRTFHSLDEVNEAVAECVEKINDRTMRRVDKSRRELYLEVDKPNLSPLPETRFEFSDWKIKARVNLDYHVVFEKNYYSVPYQHTHQHVDIRATTATVEIFLTQKRIASHERIAGKHRYSTKAEHMPRSHRQHAKWSPSRLIRWGETVGPSTATLVEAILNERPHPEQGYRACLGILRLGKEHRATPPEPPPGSLRCRFATPPHRGDPTLPDFDQRRATLDQSDHLEYKPFSPASPSGG